MIPTTSVEWSDWPSPNCHLAIRSKSGTPGRQEGGVAEKAVPFSAPLFEAKPVVASHRCRGPG